MTVGERIRHWRKYRKMTQEDLASVVGVSQSAVSFWEGEGVHQNDPDLSRLEKVAKAFRVSMEKFYGPIPKPSKRRAS